MLSPLEDAELRRRVVQTVRAHWTRPSRDDGAAPTPPGKVEDVARSALDAMLTRPFRVGPRPPPEVYNQLIGRVRRWVARGRPISVSVGYGALKNPNAVADSRADWAEFFALCHLIAWQNKVRAVYPPGLDLRLIFDDVTLLWANRGDGRAAASYIASMGELIRALGFEQVLTRSSRLLSLTWICRALYPAARWRVRRWERDPTNREQIERMAEAARRNLALPPGLGPSRERAAAEDAAHRYRVYWEALRLSRKIRGERDVVAMYLDGSQHHIPQPVTLHLTTLDKGQVTQPWQGQGALRDNGHGRLEPYVLTVARRQRSEVKIVGGLDLLPLPGFDQIAVAWVAPSGAVGLGDRTVRTGAD